MFTAIRDTFTTKPNKGETELLAYKLWQTNPDKTVLENWLEAERILWQPSKTDVELSTHSLWQKNPNKSSLEN